MVKILPNGEIVADDDPRLPSSNTNDTRRRAQQQQQQPPPRIASPRGADGGSNSSSWSFGLGSPAVEGAQGRGGIGTPTNAGAGAGNNNNNNEGSRVESVTVFDLLNERMIDAGFPRLHLGPYPVEPVAVVGTCFALMLFGLPGLILSLVLFFVVKFSRHGVPSLNDLIGGGRGGERRVERGPEVRRDARGGGGGGDGDGMPERRRQPPNSPEEEKWGTGHRLGGR